MILSLNELRGLAIETRDGRQGKAADFLFDDWVWTIRYFVVDTGGWLTGREVLISPAAFERVDRQKRTLSVALTSQQIKDSPPIESHLPFLIELLSLIAGLAEIPIEKPRD